METNTTQCFGQNICKLLRGGCVGYDDVIFNTLTDEVVADVDVLALVVKHQILAQCNGPLVVDA
jgi:hypothetical protein